jgi:outer membrane protein assembly factor BamB
MRTFNGFVLLFGCTFVWTVAAHAQFRGGPEWATAGGDAQRSSWVRSDPKISAERIAKPGFALAWKIKLGAEPSVASTLSSYIGYRGFRSFAFLGSASGELTTIDTDLGRIEWQKKLTGGPVARTSGPCQAGMTANVARLGAVAFPGAPAGRGGGGGRGGPAKSDVGQPGEGGVTIKAAAAAADAAAAAARGRGGASGMPGGAGRGPRKPDLLSAVSSDGMYHAVYISNGEEPNPPISFLPANANARQLTVVNDDVYAATSNGCGGAPNGVWALDTATKEVRHWTPPAGDIAGGGFAFGPDAKIYASTTSGDLVALDPKKLEAQGVYRAANEAFSASPVVFEFKTKAMIAAPTKEGHIHLVDASALTGSAYPGSVAGALASWQDAGGTRWIVAPSKDLVAAWKIGDQGDAVAMLPGWKSAEMPSPLAPIIVNGVVFAVSNSPSAVLHALDGATGKELWNSGKTMTAAVHIGGLSGSGSQIYLGTSDGTVYAFGFPIEH